MDHLIKDITDYCNAARIKPSTFGTYAAGDGKLLSRLTSKDKGGAARQCLPRTEDKIRRFIAENPPETLRKKGGRA